MLYTTYNLPVMLTEFADMVIVCLTYDVWYQLTRFEGFHLRVAAQPFRGSKLC